MKIKINEKNKYFIYNEEYKILVFSSKSERNNVKISLPGLEMTDTYIDDKESFHKKIISMLISEDRLCYLGENVTTSSIYESENNKLKKVELKKIRNYYSCYKKFSKEEINEIVKLCNENEFEPYFLTIEELIKLINTKNIKLHSKDALMKESLVELNRRLNFIKY